ncbi:hypothetical protein ACFLZ2_06070, partial [Candidatus Margulisiibacteriota bacterium]
MSISKLGQYFQQFDQSAKNDGFIDSKEDWEEYKQLLKSPQKSSLEITDDKKIDFWEYMELIAPNKVKNMARKSVQLYADKKTLENKLN